MPPSGSQRNLIQKYIIFKCVMSNLSWKLYDIFFSSSTDATKLIF